MLTLDSNLISLLALALIYTTPCACNASYQLGYKLFNLQKYTDHTDYCVMKPNLT